MSKSGHVAENGGFMDLVTRIAEQRIAKAEERGELSGLAGEGHPQNLDDLSGVPRDVRPAYIMLKNGGFVPPELHTRRMIREVEDLLDACAEHDLGECRRLQGRLAVLLSRLEREHGRRLAVDVRAEYEGALGDRLDRD